MKVSEDKKTITLDVPIGTELFTYTTDCNNTCCRNACDEMKVPVPEDMRKRVKAAECECSMDAPCHVLYTGIRKEILTVTNCEQILPFLNTRWFLTRKEAKEAGIAKVMEHRNMLKEKGLPFGEHGKRLAECDYQNDVGR